MKSLERSDWLAIGARVGVAFGTFLVVQLICWLAGWDSSFYGVLTGFAAYLGYDRLMARRRDRAAARSGSPAP